ncbi:hypothetical protein CFIMG_008424RA00001 [Ceratocystis fimbriata CBS 114723]|uniref:Uncharacterized protein n=1 Tax=Ceratocystis fimbriata CBS 114723 TaxID=1035309 RepID=A0A2C5X212_9PEZI|nr:hypothetical protein CFIMG_008424RA00001 [Ceratocystis fimbriata CBS 114723]
MNGPARSFAYHHVANIQSFEELCQHTKWHKDVLPPPYLKSATPENIQDRIRIASKCMVGATMEQYLDLKPMFEKIKDHRNYVNLDNFNIYLALEGSYSTWCNVGALPKASVFHKVEKVCSHIDEYSSSSLYESRPWSLLHLHRPWGFKKMELAHPGFEHTSTILCRKLELYHDQFHDDRNEFLYPYTTVVASLGMGKTFAVSQLAVKHSKYVLYMNLSKEKDSYPNMSCYSDQFVGNDAKTEAWIWGIKGLLHLARAARASGVSPEAFFRIQTDEDYTPQQLAIRKIIVDIVESEKHQDQDYWDTIDRRCYDVIKEVKAILPPRLQSQPAPGDFPKLQFVVCIDGASSILQDYKGPKHESNFNCLQNSLRVLSENEKAFFAVLVDRSAAIMDLSPAIYQDLNQRTPNDKQLSKRLFPPFIQFFTKNLVGPYNAVKPDSAMSSEENIMALGRPLLGTRLFWGGSFQDAEEIVPCNISKVTKVVPDELKLRPGIPEKQVKQIALLSYRINFSICDTVLAKELLDRWMYNLIDVSEDREHLLVAPPSEPILATISRKHGMGEINVDFLAALEVLKDFLYWRIVAIENGAEFVAGVVSLIGCDAAKSKDNKNEYLSPARVLDFLGCLMPLAKVIEFPKGYREQHNSIAISLSLNSLVHYILGNNQDIENFFLDNPQRFVGILQSLASPYLARRNSGARYYG